MSLDEGARRNEDRGVTPSISASLIDTTFRIGGLEDYFPVLERFHMFKAFQAIIISFVFVYSIIVIVMVFFLYNTDWLQDLLEETMQLFIFVSIAYVFRLRNFQGSLPQRREVISLGDLELDTISDSSRSKKAVVSESQEILIGNMFDDYQQRETDASLPPAPQDTSKQESQPEIRPSKRTTKMIVLSLPPMMVNDQLTPNVALATNSEHKAK